MSLGLALSLTLGGLPTVTLFENKVEAADYEFTKEQKETLNYINELRKNMGLKPVELNPFLIKAAENHAKYLEINNIGGEAGLKAHNEIQGKKGFTGVNPADRVEALIGYYLPVAEGISFQQKKLLMV